MRQELYFDDPIRANSRATDNLKPENLEIAGLAFSSLVLAFVIEEDPEIRRSLIDELSIFHKRIFNCESPDGIEGQNYQRSARQLLSAIALNPEENFFTRKGAQSIAFDLLTDKERVEYCKALLDSDTQADETPNYSARNLLESLCESIANLTSCEELSPEAGAIFLQVLKRVDLLLPDFSYGERAANFILMSIESFSVDQGKIHYLEALNELWKNRSRVYIPDDLASQICKALTVDPEDGDVFHPAYADLREDPREEAKRACGCYLWL